jgi:large subunit ribosomal protein L29
MTDIAELRGKSPDELKDMAVSLKKELFNLRFLASSGESPNTSRFRQIRRDVARVKTLLNDPAAAHAPAKKAKAPKKEKAAAETKTKKTTAKKKASGE